MGAPRLRIRPATRTPPCDGVKIRSRASVRVIFSCWAHNVVKWNINHWAQSLASSLLACFQFVWVFQTLQAKIRLGSASRLIRTQAHSQHPPLKCISSDHSSWKWRCKCTKALCADKKFNCSNHPGRKTRIYFSFFTWITAKPTMLEIRWVLFGPDLRKIEKKKRLYAVGETYVDLAPE